MSIPKEPRQLMINLMYLVLTAMLALNVSAEIINAFYAMNRGIKKSNDILGQTNDKLFGAIQNQAKESPKYAEFASGASNAQQISKEFETYIKGVYDQLVKDAGGIDPKYGDRPVRYKDKDVTTNLLINQKKGEEIEAKIKAVKDKYLALIPASDRKELENQIPLQVDSISKDSKAKTWPEYKFKQMPVGAVLANLSKWISDAKTGETAIMNYFFNKMSIQDIKFDQFKVAIAPKKAYLIRGEKFEADIYLAAFSSNPGSNVSLSANGQGLSMREGVAQFSETPGGIGEKTVTASATIRNPLTGESKTVQGQLKYEVGEKSATVSAEKMNVFYIGVDNPIAVSAAGVSSNSLRVNCSGCESLNKKDDNNYVVRVNRPGEATITLSAEGGLNVQKKFRIKPIPDPSPRITVGDDKSSRGGPMPSGSFSVNNGVIAELKNFDFDAKCSIQSYILVRVPRREDPQQASVNGTSNGEAERLQRMAKPGDLYQFMEIKARCPGDVVARSVGSMSFFIR